MNNQFDVIIVGAGAAGLFCGQLLGKRGVRTLIVDHSDKVGKKILISGGGRCNFTNLEASHKNYLCSNPHFVKSALSRFNPYEILDYVIRADIPYFEKKAGQLFCERSSKDFLKMLLEETLKAGAKIEPRSKVESIHFAEQFQLMINGKKYQSKKLVIATGGISFPKLGATDFGYKIAKQFGHKIIPYSPALVGLQSKQFPADLSGISLPVAIKIENRQIHEDLLFTHKGISGPAVLTASLYAKKEQSFFINFFPTEKIATALLDLKQSSPKTTIKERFLNTLPNKFLFHFIDRLEIPYKESLHNISNQKIETLGQLINRFEFIPTGTDGYEKAEVTRGGVDTHQISSKSMESTLQSGLYFIGEVMDVTGELGGFNFQWAWASAHACAKNIEI